MYKEEMRKALWVLEETPLPDQVGKTVLSPLHYGDTVEVVFFRGVEGEFTVNGKKFELEGDNVFFIPPRRLHSGVYRRGGRREEDMIRAFHINVEGLSSYLDLKTLFRADGRTFSDVPVRCGEFDRIYTAARETLREDLSFAQRLAALIGFFDLLFRQEGDLPAPEYYFNAGLVVNWLEEHYGEKLTVEAAAARFGYNKHYFCKWIKENTGSTFNELLNSVRIHRACTLLAEGHSVGETAEACGYADPSYFIKVFKKVRNQTPKAFVSGLQKRRSDRLFP